MDIFEKETIINFNEGEENAEIYSCTSSIWNRCVKLGLKQTDEQKDSKGRIISKSYECPKKWVSIRKPRVYSEKELDKKRERLKELNEKRKIQNSS